MNRVEQDAQYVHRQDCFRVPLDPLCIVASPQVDRVGRGTILELDIDIPCVDLPKSDFGWWSIVEKDIV